MAYTPFENVQSGLNGTVKGLMPLDSDGARAFAYRKEIEIKVMIDPADDIPQRHVRGRWQVRVRSSDARDPDGNYVGVVVFEQTVEWMAIVTVIQLGGGLALVTWHPTEAKLQTSVVDTQECPVIENLATATEAQLNQYRVFGAWRFLDNVNLPPEESAEFKYNQEKNRGITLFTPEGASTVFGYTFFATWQSPYYECFLEEGAILETVYDQWQNGQLTEALYTVSWEAESSGAPSIFDGRTGQRFYGVVDRRRGSTHVEVQRTRQLRSPHTELEGRWFNDVIIGDATDNGVLEKDVPLRGVQLFYGEGGALWALGCIGVNMRMYLSYDQGENWYRLMNEPAEVTPLTSCLTSDGSRIIVYGLNAAKAPAYAVLKFGAPKDPKQQQGGLPAISEWHVAESGRCEGHNLPQRGVGQLTQSEGGLLRLIARDSTTQTLRMLVSRDGGKSYSEEQTT